MRSGYYCIHHWREVVSATWPLQELCACVRCTQTLQVQALPCAPQPCQVPSCKLGTQDSGRVHTASAGATVSAGTGSLVCRRVRAKVLEGGNFGRSEYTVWEVFDSPEQGKQEPHLFVWLHGAHQRRYLPQCAMQTMQRKLGCRILFLMPLNPEGVAPDGRCSHWFVSYTKAQNRRGLAWIYGESNSEYLAAICEVVRGISREMQASRILVGGYSMGGFGAYQLGSHEPGLFDVVLSIAGYGIGTLEPPDGHWSVQQPECSIIFEQFLTGQISRLAAVPAVVIIHARSDKVSSFLDTLYIVDTIEDNGGYVDFVIVPDNKSEGKLGHNYFNYALLDDSSEEVLYRRLREILTLGCSDVTFHC